MAKKHLNVIAIYKMSPELLIERGKMDSFICRKNISQVQNIYFTFSTARGNEYK